MRLILFCLCFGSFGSLAQEKYMANLPVELTESSGLVIYKNYFISMNDSGSEPLLYVFTRKGVLLRTVQVNNATNKDWEALTIDNKGNLYIADSGDNSNKRKSVVIYIVSADEVITATRVDAKRLELTYLEKTAFPPEETNLYYDAEAIVHRNDSLFIFTKNRTKPFDGIVKVYGFPDSPGSYQAAVYAEIQLPATNWLENSVTDATRCGNRLFLLTYRYVYEFSWEGKTFHQVRQIEFDISSQKEGLFYKDGVLFLTDEKSILGKPRLYRLRLPR
jgi:hypothetical protein